jgi:ABC-type transport system involved in multi-copper enzyme maturation permease subunit
MPVVIFLVKDTFSDMPPPFPSSKEFYEFPGIWDYQGYIGSWWVSLLLGFLAIYMTSSEFSQKTLRQNIITGMKRKNLFWAKIIFLTVISVVATLIYAFSSVITGVVHTDGYDISLVFDNNMAILRYFLLCLGYLSIAFFFVVLFRKGILAIIVYMLYMLVLEPLMMAIYVYQFKNSGRNYFPMNAIEDLMPFPLYKMPDYFINKEWDFSILLSQQQAMLMAVIYITFFTVISYALFMKRDI